MRSRAAGAGRDPFARTTASMGRHLSWAKHARSKRAARSISNSEKYEIKRWNRDAPNSLRPLITLLNQARRPIGRCSGMRTWSSIAQTMRRFMAYSKATADGDRCGPHDRESGSRVHTERVDRRSIWTSWGLTRWGDIRCRDLLANRGISWRGRGTTLSCVRYEVPAHVFHVNRAGSRAACSQ